MVLKPVLTDSVSLIKVINHLLGPVQVSGVVYEETAGRCVRDLYTHTHNETACQEPEGENKALIAKETGLL